MYRIRTAGAAGLLALIVAACSNGPAASPSASTTPIASPSAIASASESASSESSSSALPSFELPNTAPELLELLPDQVGDLQPLPQSATSQTGEEFMAADDNQEFVDFLERLGAEPEDISVATTAYGTVDNPAGAVIVFAFRVAGGDTDQLLEDMKSTLTEDTPDVTWESQTIAGKQVQVATTDEAGTTTYLYAREDIAFAVITSDAAAAEDALGQLP